MTLPEQSVFRWRDPDGDEGAITDPDEGIYDAIATLEVRDAETGRDVAVYVNRGQAQAIIEELGSRL